MENIMNYKEIFLETLKGTDNNWKGFAEKLSKSDTILLTEELTDDEFEALYNLRLHHDKRGYGFNTVYGITKSFALGIISKIDHIKPWHIGKIFRVICEYGFLSLSTDHKEAFHIDPGYDYTRLFTWYTNLMEVFKLGELQGFDYNIYD